jgi:hypothetical protein
VNPENGVTALAGPMSLLAHKRILPGTGGSTGGRSGFRSSYDGTALVRGSHGRHRVSGRSVSPVVDPRPGPDVLCSQR